MKNTECKTNKSCEISLSVPFHDLDPMNMVFHANYLKYFDKARFHLFWNQVLIFMNISKIPNSSFPLSRPIQST